MPSTPSNFGLGAPRSLAEVQFIDAFGPSPVDIFSDASLNARWPCLAPMPDELVGSSRLVERHGDANPTGQLQLWRQNQVPVHVSVDPKQVRDASPGCL